MLWYFIKYKSQYWKIMIQWLSRCSKNYFHRHRTQVCIKITLLFYTVLIRLVFTSYKTNTCSASSHLPTIFLLTGLLKLPSIFPAITHSLVWRCYHLQRWLPLSYNLDGNECYQWHSYHPHLGISPIHEMKFPLEGFSNYLLITFYNVGKYAGQLLLFKIFSHMWKCVIL
jgi:hypothetical protein